MCHRRLNIPRRCGMYWHWCSRMILEVLLCESWHKPVAPTVVLWLLLLRLRRSGPLHRASLLNRRQGIHGPIPRGRLRRLLDSAGGIFCAGLVCIFELRQLPIRIVLVPLPHHALANHAKKGQAGQGNECDLHPKAPGAGIGAQAGPIQK